MRKWTYLVAALLIGGTAATVTSCIDNEEPAGITELRGAKAELLKAKAQVEAADAAYRMAETAWMQAKADYQAELVKQEAFKTQWHEAYTASEKQRIEQEMQISAEQFKADLLAKQQATAQAQAEYDKAIIAIEAALVGYKESVYAAELEKLLNDTYSITYQQWVVADNPEGGYWTEASMNCSGLSGLSNQIARAQNTIARIMRQKAALEFSYDINTKIAATEGQLAIEKGTLQGLEKQLENLKVLQGKPFEEWDAQYKVYEEQQKALDIQKTNLSLAKEEALKPILEKQTANTKAADAKSEFAFAIPEEIQNDFFNIDIDYVYNNQAIKGSEGKWSYPNGIKDMMTMNEKAIALQNLFSNIDRYIVSDNQLEQANRRLAQYKITNDNNQNYYTNTLLPTWKTALEAYKTLFDAGKYFASGINDYDVIVKEFETYMNLPESTAAEITAKETAQKAFATKLKAYLAKRAELDGFKIMKTADATKVIDPTVEADWNQWLAIGGNKDSMFGYDIFNNYPNYGGAYKDYVEAAKKIGYNYSINPAYGRCVEYTYEEYLKNNRYMQENNWDDGDAKVVFDSRWEYESLKSAIDNKPSWDKLHADLKALEDANDKALNDLKLLQMAVAEEKAVIESDFDAQEASIDVQLAGISSIMSVIERIIQNGQGGYNYDNALQNLKDAIAALESGRVYQGDDFIFSTGNSSIPAQKAVIAMYEKLLAALKDGSYKPQEDAQIAYCQAQINTCQNQVDALTVLFNAASKKKDQLLAALAGTPAQ